MSRSHRIARLCLNSLETRLVQTAGVLDPTFGVGGRVETAFPVPSDDNCSSTAVDGLDRIIVAGTARDSLYGYFALARFTASGALDTTFGGTGRFSFDFGAKENQAKGVAVDSQNRIIMAGYSDDGTGTKFAVARLTAAGALDTSFDSDGKETISVGPGASQALAVAIDSQDRVVLAGFSYNGSHNDIAVVRLTSAGALDVSFDGDGKQVFDVGTGNNSASGVAIDSQDRVIVAGSAFNGTNYGFAVARLTPGGALDSSFNGDGKQLFNFAAEDEGAVGVAVDALDRVVVAGTSHLGGPTPQPVIARMTVSGAFDSSFDNDGKQTIDIYGGPSAIAVDSQDRVLLAGSTIARLTTTGILDTSFDSDGLIGIDLGGGGSASSIAMAAQGKVVIAGNRLGNDSDFAVACLTSGGEPDVAFGDDGQQSIGFAFRSNASPARVQTDSHGRIVVAGFDFPHGEFALTRYLPDGTLDSSFGGTGIVTHGSGPANCSLAIDSQDRVLLAFGDFDINVARFTASGVLDPTFGVDGDQTVSFPGTSTQTGGMVVDSMDRVVVTGTIYNGWQIAVARLTNSGLLDATFDADGQQTIDFGYQVGTYDNVTTDSMDRIIVADGGNGFVNVARLTTTGALDTTFDIDGKQSVPFGSPNFAVVSMTVDSQDRVIVGGRLSTADAFGVVRFTEAGALDTAFDVDGKQSIPFGPNTYTRDIAVDSLDRVVLAGEVSNGDHYVFGVGRLTIAGTLDSTFDTDGKQTTDLGPVADYVGVTVDSFGRIVETGSVLGYWDVIRLTGDTPPAKVTSVAVNDGSPQRSMVTSLKVTFDSKVSFAGTPASAFQLTRQSDNAPVTLAANVDASGTSVTLTFTGGAIDLGGSLADGRYTLKILANHFSGLGFDGDGDGLAETSPIDDYVLVGAPANGLFRLFGDADGNGLVDGVDFGAFRSAFNTNSNVFDFDGSGVVDGLDFGRFRQNFGVMV